MPYLSQAWLDRQRELVGALPERPGATATVLHVVSGAPAGEVRFTHAIVDGRLTAAARRRFLGAEVTLTATYPDAVADRRASSTATWPSCRAA